MTEEKPDSKTSYSVAAKKHKLPTYEEMDDAFEISELELNGTVLREVRKKIAEKVGHICAMIEQILHPDSNLSDLYESRVLNEIEKKELFETYKKLMVADRTLTELYISSSEEQDAKFIKTFYEEWNSLKPKLLVSIRKLRDSWKKKQTIVKQFPTWVK